MNANDFLISAILELKDIEEVDLTPDITLEDIMLDSLDYVEIQVGIKKNFGVEILTDLFTSGQVRTLGELINYIEENKVEEAATLRI